MGSIKSRPSQGTKASIMSLYKLHLLWTPPLAFPISILNIHLSWTPMDSTFMTACLFLNLHLPWTPMDSTYSIPYLHLKHPPPMDSNGLSWTFYAVFFS